MMLMELTHVPVEALPVAAFRDHLKLGTGFSDDGVQDAVLETCLRAALAVVEGQTGKALLQREFEYTVSAWRDFGAQPLPVAPVTEVRSVAVVGRDGAEKTVDAAKYYLERDAHRPRLVASGIWLPPIPLSGTAKIVFLAGYAAAWDELPADLAQAVMLLAALYYERRDAGPDMPDMPFGVRALVQRYRRVRLFGGRG